MTQGFSYYSGNDGGDSRSAYEDRQVDFADAVLLLFRNSMDFAGRSSRGAFWFAMLFVVLAGFLASIADDALGLAGLTSISFAWAVITVFPVSALHIRRLHDIGKSGMWYLLAGTGLGYLLVLVWAARAGERRTNGFGPNIEAGRELC